MFLQAASSNALHVLKDILIRFLLNLVLINNQLIAGAKLERQGPPRRGGRQVVLLLQSYSFQPCGFVDRHLHTPSGNGETFPRHDDRRRESRHEGQESHASRDTSSDECSSARSTQRVYIRIFSIESRIYLYTVINRDTRNYIPPTGSFYHLFSTSSRGRWFVAFIETDDGARVATLGLHRQPSILIIFLGHESVTIDRVRDSLSFFETLPLFFLEPIPVRGNLNFWKIEEIEMGYNWKTKRNNELSGIKGTNTRNGNKFRMATFAVSVKGYQVRKQ